eukprot:scaffold652_cov260-Pinguiococcus_pyrenoidosus.AAC.4
MARFLHPQEHTDMNGLISFRDKQRLRLQKLCRSRLGDVASAVVLPSAAHPTHPMYQQGIPRSRRTSWAPRPLLRMPCGPPSPLIPVPTLAVQ